MFPIRIFAERLNVFPGNHPSPSPPHFPTSSGSNAVMGHSRAPNYRILDTFLWGAGHLWGRDPPASLLSGFHPSSRHHHSSLSPSLPPLSLSMLHLPGPHSLAVPCWGVRVNINGEGWSQRWRGWGQWKVFKIEAVAHSREPLPLSMVLRSPGREEWDPSMEKAKPQSIVCISWLFGAMGFYISHPAGSGLCTRTMDLTAAECRAF